MNTTCDSRRKQFIVQPFSCRARSAQRTQVATSEAEGMVLRCVQCLCTYAPRQRRRSESVHLRSGTLTTVDEVVSVTGSWFGSICAPLGMDGNGFSVFFCRALCSSLFSSCCLSAFFPSFRFLWIRSLAAAEVSLRISSDRRARSQFFSLADSQCGIPTRVVIVI